MADDRGLNLRLSEESVARVLTRAAELDGSARQGFSIEQVREIATEAGISARAIEMALDEHTNHSAGSQPSAPAWVRMGMIGVPDRGVAIGFYWLFVAGLMAFPIGAFVLKAMGWGNVSMSAAMGGMIFCTFASWSTARMIRWLDKNGWSTLRPQ